MFTLNESQFADKHEEGTVVFHLHMGDFIRKLPLSTKISQRGEFSYCKEIISGKTYVTAYNVPIFYYVSKKITAIVLIYILTNYMVYGTRRCNAAITRALQ